MCYLCKSTEFYGKAKLYFWTFSLLYCISDFWTQYCSLQGLNLEWGNLSAGALYYALDWCGFALLDYFALYAQGEG